MSNIHFKIKNLRQRSMIATQEAILVVFSALVVIAILPTLLLRYLYADQQLFEQPKVLEYIPVIAFVIAMFYALKAIIGNWRRERQARQLVMEMEMMGDDCCGNCGGHSHSDSASDEDWDEDLKELEELLAEVEDEEKGKKSSKKSSTKATTKKKATRKSSKK